MRGEFIGVWSETWREIWLPLIDHDDVPEDIFCELYRELAGALKDKPSVEALADIIDNPVQSREAFEKTGANEFTGERALVAFLEAAHSALDELAGDELSNRHFNLLAGFIEKFSLRHDCSDGRIKTCIQKPVNLLEAIGRAAPGVTGTTLGAICNQVGTWPHDKLKEAMKDLYDFASDYPGIRHGGTPANALRAVDMRDMVAAMEKALAELLGSAGLRVMNRVVSRKPLDEARFAQVRVAFAKAFPQIAAAADDNTIERQTKC